MLIPYIGSEESLRSGGLIDQENWGEPTILEGAAFDVSYFEREEDGVTQGYWVMPSSNRLRVGKVTMGPKGTVPLLDGELQTIYSVSQPWEYGKQAPTPSDTSEGTDQAVIEAPFMIEYGDYIYLTYSGGTVDKYYDLGLLRADKGANLQDPTSWTQVPFPVLDTNDTYTGRIASSPHGGTGHNSFAIDESGNIVLAYHARPYPEQHSGSAAGGLFDPDRNSWFKSVNVRANGMIDLSMSSDQEVSPENRTVTVRVVVSPASESVLQAVATTRCVAGKVVLVITATNSGERSTSATITTAFGDKRIANIGAEKSVSSAISTRLVSVAQGTLNVLGDDSASPISVAYQATTCR